MIITCKWDRQIVKIYFMKCRLVLEKAFSFIILSYKRHCQE